MNSLKTLKRGLEELEVSLSEKQLNEFLEYKNLLKEWNQKIDITTMDSDEEIDTVHFLDSLTLLKTGLFDGEKSVIDVGTGGGFPGLPLKIYNKNLEVCLMDSLLKRINFLKIVVEDLGLEKVEAVHERAEEIGRDKKYRDNFDIAVSRAVARVNTLVEYCMPFVKVGGHFVSMKGPDYKEELEEAKNGIDTLGGRVKEHFKVKVPETDIEHSIIVVEKLRPTPKKYPRGGGKPRKKPL